MSGESIVAPLSAPAPLGRVVRLGLGAVLLYGTWNLARFGPSEIGRQLVNPVEWLIHMASLIGCFQPSSISVGTALQGFGSGPWRWAELQS